MATPVGDSYTCVSGGSISAGRGSNRVVLVGDSLTSEAYGGNSTFWYVNALAGGPLKLVENIGVVGDSVADVLARIDNNYLAASPGMAGIGNVGLAILRIGTNDTRFGTAISSPVQTAYSNLIAKLLTYANHVIVLAVPPVSSTGGGVNGFNSWLSSYCATVPKVTFINDTTTVNAGDGSWASGYAPSDGIHYGPKAAQRMAIDGAAAFAAAVNAAASYPSPVSYASADVYPTVPQWVSNHLMSGTGGSNSIGSGSVPTGWSVESVGAGFAANCLIVAAAGDDPNPTPWLRITPGQINNSGYMRINGTLVGRAITTSDPSALEIVVEYRFNSFAATRLNSIKTQVVGNNAETLTPPIRLWMGDADMDGVIVGRTAIRRLGTKLSHSVLGLQVLLEANQAYTGAMGSFDFRCVTVRG